MSKKNLMLLFSLLILTLAISHPSSPAAEKDKEAARLEWWREARFGMFVHWGPVSLKGTEIGWSRGQEVPTAEYDQLYKNFNPVKFDAEVWASIAKAAGMKYLVLTSKHHDGFCLWDTKQTDYNITRTPFKRDILRELADACKRQGLIFCTYYSILDWYHPDYPLGSPGGKSRKSSPNMDQYWKFLKSQMAELIQNYGPLGILWFDGEWEEPWTREDGVDLYRYCRKLQPSILVNNRVGKGRKGMEGVTSSGEFGGDYDTPEQTIGKFQQSPPWETNMTMCEQWAWKPNDKLKSLKQCLQTLITCAGGDGNFLLNVGPMPSGEIEPRQVARLQEIGAWLRRCGQSIYGTRGGPYKPGAWGASTHRGDKVYLHLFPSEKGKLMLPALPFQIKSWKTLTGGQAQIMSSAKGLEVTISSLSGDPICNVIELQLNQSAGKIAPMPVEE